MSECASCRHPVHVTQCSSDGCACGVCVWPGSIEAVADMVASIQSNVNRMLPFHEDVRQMRHQLDLLAARIECLSGDVQACTRAVEAMAESLRSHAGDAECHYPRAVGDNGNAGRP